MISILYSYADLVVRKLSGKFCRVTQLLHHTCYAAMRNAKTSRDCLCGAKVVAAYVVSFCREILLREKKKQDGVSAQRSCMQDVRGTKNFGESGVFV